MIAPNTTVASDSEQRYCNKCKKTCGHYTHQHDDWVEICKDIANREREDLE